MDQSSNKKILTVSFLIAGALTAFVFVKILNMISPLFGGQVHNILAGTFATQILPVLIGGALFAYLQFNKNANVWADEVITEIKKVVWPSRRDTVAMTIVVIIMTLISAGVIWAFDVASAFFVNYLVTL
jgi:preprotein translocase subunit SecE